MTAKLENEPRPKPVPPKGIGRFLPFYVHQTWGVRRIAVQWRLLMLWTCVAACVGYLGMVSAAYWFVKNQRQFSTVRFGDLFWPHRWDDYRLARGNYLVEQAKAHIEKQEYREAFLNLRVAVDRAPANREGRLMLAQFLMLFRRPDLTKKLLLEGIPFHRDDPEYLRPLFQFLLDQQDDLEVIRLADELLPAQPELNPRNRLIAMALATASFSRGIYDRAEDALQGYQLLGLTEGRLLAIRIEWERGNQSAALEQLRALTAQNPKEDAFARQLVTYYRESGNDREAERVAFLRQLSHPEAAWPRIELLYAYHRDHDDRRLREATSDYLAELSGQEPALVALADFAANTGNPAVASRALEAARSHGFDTQPLVLMNIESQIMAAEYHAALSTIRRLELDDPAFTKRFAAVLHGFKAIAYYATGNSNEADLYLSNFLREVSVRSENLIAVSQRLVSVGARRPARAVLERAVSANPLDQTALVGLIRLDLDTNNSEHLVANLGKLLELRKPPSDLLERASSDLGSDRLIFESGRTAMLERIRDYLAARRAASERPAS